MLAESFVDPEWMCILKATSASMPLQSIPQPLSTSLQELHQLINTLKEAMKPVPIQNPALTKSIAACVGVSLDNFIESGSCNVEME